jgi:hypothetical protein
MTNAGIRFGDTAGLQSVASKYASVETKWGQAIFGSSKCLTQNLLLA